MKKAVSSLLAFSLITLFLPFVTLGGTVLQLMPDSSTGFIRIKSLRGLSDDLKGLIVKMSPTGEEPREDPLASLLRNAFGGKYRSISDLEKLGFDVKGDFGIAFSAPDLKSTSVLIGISDRAKLEASLATLIHNPLPETYSGAKYYKFSNGYYTILRDIFVFSKNLNSLMTAIDLYQHRLKPILDDPEFRSLSLSLEDDVTLFMRVNKVVGRYNINSMLRAQGKIMSNMLNQIHLLGMNAEIDGVEIRVDGIAKFRPDSKFAELNGGKVISLDRFSKLPPYQVCGVGDLKGIFTYAQDEMFKELQMDERVRKALKSFRKGVGELVSFAINLSDSPSELIPSTVFVYEITDTESVSDFLDALPEIIRQLNTDTYKPFPFEIEMVEPGQIEVCNGVEIKSLVVKFRPHDKGKQPPFPVPKRMKIQYAIRKDRLLYAESFNSNPMRDLLEAMEEGRSAINMEGFYETTSQILSDPTTVILISPMGLVKPIRT